MPNNSLNSVSLSLCAHLVPVCYADWPRRSECYLETI